RGDLHVRDPRRGDDVAPPLVVDEAQHAGPVLERVVDQGLDLVRRLVAGHHELARALRDADLDLHRWTSWSRRPSLKCAAKASRARGRERAAGAPPSANATSRSGPD